MTETIKTRAVFVWNTTIIRPTPQPCHVTRVDISTEGIRFKYCTNRCTLHLLSYDQLMNFKNNIFQLITYAHDKQGDNPG